MTGKEDVLFFSPLSSHSLSSFHFPTFFAIYSLPTSIFPNHFKDQISSFFDNSRDVLSVCFFL